MSDFLELHQEILRDHFKSPSYRAVLDPEAPLFENPSCGDQLRLQLTWEGDRVASCRFDGFGCSISMASTDMMCGLLEGKTRQEAQEIVRRFLEVMRGVKPPEELEPLGDVVALGGVAQLPVRAKCATLAWNAAARLLERQGPS